MAYVNGHPVRVVKTELFPPPGRMEEVIEISAEGRLGLRVVFRVPPHLVDSYKVGRELQVTIAIK